MPRLFILYMATYLEALNVPPARTRLRARPGYSLIEILGVFMIITLVAGIAVASFGRIVVAAETKPWETRFREAVREARIQAAASGETILLEFDAGRGEFRLIDRNEAAAQDGFPDDTQPFERVGGNAADGIPEIEFYPRLSSDTGGRVFQDPFGRTAVAHLAFHPSGVSTPARIHFNYADGRASVLTLDPFSFGPLPERPTSS